MNFKSFRAFKKPVSLKNLDLKGKNVLVRVDFNCPVEKGKVTNNYRIVETLPTLRLLKKKGAKKITLVTHFGRPDGKYSATFSVKPVRLELEKLWGKKVFCPPYQTDFKKYADSVLNDELQVTCLAGSPCRSLRRSAGRQASYELRVCMWENIRFWPEEEKNDTKFAKALVKDQDIFINEAFSASHREHASVVGAAKLLPAYAGLRLAEEVREIHQLMTKKVSPSVAIVGGAKIETKIPVLEALGRNYDKIILGGKIAIEYEGLKNRKYQAWTKKVELPSGYLGEQKQDIDEKSALEFAKIIKLAKKIIWNGPMGKFEDKKFRKGSEIIARAVAQNKKARRLSGGGDTVELLEELGLQKRAGFVSTGGGAMLDYIAYGTLPGIEKLKY
ncbi:MAG: phosphoglycerate kinase [Candidatus Moraniibacteriota bacterium]